MGSLHIPGILLADDTALKSNRLYLSKNRYMLQNYMLTNGDYITLQIKVLHSFQQSQIYLKFDVKLFKLILYQIAMMF